MSPDAGPGASKGLLQAVGSAAEALGRVRERSFARHPCRGRGRQCSRGARCNGSRVRANGTLAGVCVTAEGESWPPRLQRTSLCAAATLPDRQTVHGGTYGQRAMGISSDAITGFVGVVTGRWSPAVFSSTWRLEVPLTKLSGGAM